MLGYQISSMYNTIIYVSTLCNINKNIPHEAENMYICYIFGVYTDAVL